MQKHYLMMQITSSGLSLVLVTITDTDCTNEDLFFRKNDFRDVYTYSQSAHEGSGEENNNITLSNVLRFHFAC